jgi:hypothetical protein
MLTFPESIGIKLSGINAHPMQNKGKSKRLDKTGITVKFAVAGLSPPLESAG